MGSMSKTIKRSYLFKKVMSNTPEFSMFLSSFEQQKDVKNRQPRSSSSSALDFLHPGPLSFSRRLARPDAFPFTSNGLQLELLMLLRSHLVSQLVGSCHMVFPVRYGSQPFLWMFFFQRLWLVTYSCDC